MEPEARDEAKAAPERRSIRGMAATAAAIYATAAAAATLPMIARATTDLPGAFYDSSQHLWIMRWYRTCLAESRSPVISPEIQYPVGAPLGNFSPLHLQTALYLIVSSLSANDVLCFNLIWWLGLLTTGMGTFALVWYVLGDRSCALFGGLVAMLSAPVLLHARAPHLELVFLGGVPVFLLAWMHFVGRPGRGTMIAAAAAYLLASVGAAYYAVLSVVPAGLYVAIGGAKALKRGDVAWLRSRLFWLLGFGAVAGPCAMLIFGNTLWSMAHGYAGTRTLEEFHFIRAPLWSYATPTSAHLLGRVLPVDRYESSGFAGRVHESGSYLGVVSLLLILHAAFRRVRFPGAGYWWIAFAMLVLLSAGAYWEVGSSRIPLPAGLLKRHVFLFRMIRAPARFNLLAVVAAAVLAAAGLGDVLRRLPRAWMRGTAVAGLMAAATADLALVPFVAGPPVPMPACYDVLTRIAPGAPVLDAPQSPSQGDPLSAACGYWQSSHRHPTTAGYSGSSNAPFDSLIAFPSPLDADRLADPSYLEHPDSESFDVFANAGFSETAWLFLKAHRLPYVVLHLRPGLSWRPVHLERLKALMAVAKVYEDPEAILYETARLPPPSRPTLVCTEGWRLGERDGRKFRVLPEKAALAAYNPDADRDLVFTLTGSSVREPRDVRLLAGGAVLASWRIRPGSPATYDSPPFRLGTGLQILTIECDGQSRPVPVKGADAEGDGRPFGARVFSLSLAARADPRPASPASDPSRRSDHRPARR